MNYKSIALIVTALSTSIAGCAATNSAYQSPKKTIEAAQTIAFMPDVHFHDVYADFTDKAFVGIKNSQSGDHATIRTMADQLMSTRLFNENYFAFLAALDSAVSRGIKLIVLPGDFSDDGQPIHLRGFKRILLDYERNHGVRFLMSPGNHDPNRPFARGAAPKRFLTSNGDHKALFADSAISCNEQQSTDPKKICSIEVHQVGNEAIVSLFSGQGFMPHADDKYWATPFSRYNYEHYQFAHAKHQAELSKRQYEVCQNGSGGEFKLVNEQNCRWLADLSYVVELSDNTWLLSIDANVFVPHESGFKSPSNAGYNQLFKYKKHLVGWIKQVVNQAKQNGKQLIAFSHYPMSDFYDGSSEEIVQLFGSNKLQMARMPHEVTSQALSSLGLEVHVGGHMHINDTDIFEGKDGRRLLNIQAPSLAGYIPAYKTLTLSKSHLEVETVILDEVPRFNELFEHYRQEYEFLKRTGKADIWPKEILNVDSYRAFTSAHILELTKQRFVPNEWPLALKNVLMSLTGHQMMVLSKLSASQLNQVSVNEIPESCVNHSCEVLNWTGFELAVDFYRLRNAGQLALSDISPQRLEQYKTLLTNFNKKDLSPAAEVYPLIEQLKLLLAIMAKFKHELDSNHFLYDLRSGQLSSIKSHNFH